MDKEQLGLAQNKLTNLKPDMFIGLNLMLLHLQQNDINDIQAETFNSMSRLKTLFLFRNKLTNLRVNMFAGLQNLLYLLLQNNEINDIQTGTFNPTSKLKILELVGRKNKLSSLRPGMFTGLGDLEKLTLQMNAINDIQNQTFNPTAKLKSLNLSCNKLSSLRAGMFTGLGNLETLELQSNDISDIQAGTFLPTSQLKTLNLTSNMLTRLRPNTFTVLRNLQELYLGSNNINDIPAGTLTGIASLSVLDLGDILVCEASGIPTPDITVTLPSGLNKTMQSGGRVTVGANGLKEPKAANVTDQTALSESQVVMKCMINPQYNTVTAFSQHTYEDVDNLSPKGPTDPNSNGCTAINNTANVTGSQDQTVLGEITTKSPMNPQDDLEPTVSEQIYDNEDILPTSPTVSDSCDMKTTNQQVNVAASQDETASDCYQTETIRKSSNQHYGSGTAVSNQCDYLYKDTSPRAYRL
ncbi:PREDICTED: leucine-rich repeat-containing protein 15-like [Branchiostoma belcheri]|uniref:Leucine-rich repeat-containing protein 15-like n=1 Tax=Branchiostoma belcheri TaxID=7741 RepID=A0A6P4XSL9_BRABE|nr:PREDICTED: leucine-rich repeat-containing protein 15-like [Branchiostoma belcheri]